MTASKRYVPVSLVCLLIASTYSATTNPAKAGPSSSLDPYAHVQAPTAKEVEDKNNKKRAKKGLPPIHKSEPSSTKVEDISSNTTYVTAPGGGNGKAIKHNSAVAESGASGGKLFGKFPKIGLPSLPSIPLIGKGKAKPETEAEPERKVAHVEKEKATKVAAHKTQSTVAKETPIGEEVETSKVASAAKPSADESEGNVMTKTLKATTSGMVNGSKKVGSGIASGAKASGSAIAKGATMLGNGFKATGEKIKGGTGKIATIGMPHMPNPFQKKKQDAGKMALSGSTQPALAGGSPSLMIKRSTSPSNTQADQLKAASNQALAGLNDGPKDGMGLSEKMTNTFSKLNPFSKKGIASKKQKENL